MERIEQNLYEILLRNLKEAVIFADEQGRIRIFNRVAENLFSDRRGKKVLGKKWKRAIPYRNIRKQFDLVYEKQEGHHDLELAIQLPSSTSEEGETRLLQSSFYPIFDRKGLFPRLFGHLCRCDRERPALEGDQQEPGSVDHWGLGPVDGP